MQPFRVLIKLARPHQLLLATLTYILGTGIAHYLGHSVNLIAFGLSLMAVLSIQTAAYWLVEYFFLPLTPLKKDETPRHREAQRANLFQSAIALLTVSGAIIMTLFLSKLLPLPAGILLVLAIVLLVAYAAPIGHFADTGYGELFQAIAIGTIFPALAFLIQFGEFQRILTFATFPLTLLALAFYLASDFATFASDLKYGRNTLLTRLTWRRAIPVHHLLILAAFLFFAATPLMGFPWRLVLPVFLALPFAIIQIVWLQHIAGGGRTLWRFFNILTVAVFGLTIYLLALTFWIR